MFDGLFQKTLDRIEQQQEKIMAGITDIKTAQAAEKTDLATLVALVPQLLQAFANGTLSPADAQAVLDEINSEDATIKTTAASIAAALPPPAPPVGS